MNLKAYLKERKELVEGELTRLMPHGGAYPESVHRAMHHAVFAGGKRLRPILLLATAEAISGEIPPGAMEVACALECVHSYSLVHDDLPSMDNDELRRGKPTVWKEFGEATAVLAGDALLTVAFNIIAEAATRDVELSDRLLLCVQELATAAGTFGMIGGQVVDVESEGQEIDSNKLYYIHTHKTGALIRSAARMGAVLAKTDYATLNSATRYSESLGLAFQIVDDILDVQGDEEKLGKPVGSDQERNKSTYPSLHGIKRSRELAEERIEMALKEAKRLAHPEVLLALAEFVTSRDH
ncbi:polyprenyl synthetase family protein [bacterium]|nr:polyprenyl synthetase family protein [bacterium]